MGWADLFEVAGVEVAGVVHKHVDPPKPFDRCGDGGVDGSGVGDVERHGDQVVVVAEGGGDGVGVAGGGHDSVAGGEGGGGDVDAHAASGTRDEPDLLVGHISQPTRDRSSGEGDGVPGNGRTPSDGLGGRSVAGMVNRDDVREFLATRRARLTPHDVGLPTHGAHRRVPGLRREEVAVLAGVSIDYYTRLERGNLAGVSDSVLEAVARALQLDEAERAHLLDLARTANNTSTSRRRRPSEQQVRPGMQRLLDAMTGAPTVVRNGRLDVIATNPLGRALLAPAFADPSSPTNLARFTFIDPHGREFFVDWDDVANATVAILRTEAGRDPGDRNLTDLVGELATRSDEFRTRWAAHNVRLHDHGTKRFRHPVVGELALTFEELPLPADPGLTMTAYTAEPGSASHDTLALLASWTATPHDGPSPDRPPTTDFESSAPGPQPTKP